MSNIAKIRDFEFPQVFVSFDVTDHSLRHLNRRLRDYSQSKLKPFTEIPDSDNKRGRVKLQEKQYICDSGNPDDIINSILRNKSLHPVKLITLVRFLMLNNLDELPDRITKGFCLAWAGENKWYKVYLSGEIFFEEYNPLHITAETPLIIESDPI